MFSKTRIEQMINSEDKTPEKSLENANTIMFGGGYECDGIKVVHNTSVDPRWVVYAHFTHVNHGDAIEQMFTGFNLDTNKGARSMQEFYLMFNIRPPFNPFKPQNSFEWGIYVEGDRRRRRD